MEERKGRSRYTSWEIIVITQAKIMVSWTKMGEEGVTIYGFTLQIYSGGNTDKIFRQVAYEMRDREEPALSPKTDRVVAYYDGEEQQDKVGGFCFGSINFEIPIKYPIGNAR